MAPTNMNKGLEDKLSGLLSSLAITNEGVMNLTKISEKHEQLLYGTNEAGGLVTRGNVDRKTLDDHTAVLDRLEKQCDSVASFMEAQVEINKAQAETNKTINRVIFGLASMVFVIMLLIGVADISALHTLLASVHVP